jgi:hypothetical protein
VFVWLANMSVVCIQIQQRYITLTRNVDLWLRMLTICSEYPRKSPQVTAITTNGGRCRFNPNIYANGRVCLYVKPYLSRESEMQN